MELTNMQKEVLGEKFAEKLILDPRIETLAAEIDKISAFPGKNLPLAEKIIAAIDTKDNATLGGMLHVGNKVTRAAFERETGVTLPRKDKEIAECLSNWSGNAIPAPLVAKRNKPLKPELSTGNPKLDEYLKDMTPMTRGKIAKHLTRLIKYQGTTLHQSEFVEMLVNEKRSPYLYYNNTGVLKHAVINEEKNFFDLSITEFNYFIHLARVSFAMPTLAGSYRATPAEEKAWRQRKLFQGDEKQIGGQTYVFDGMDWNRKKNLSIAT